MHYFDAKSELKRYKTGICIFSMLALVCLLLFLWILGNNISRASHAKRIAEEVLRFHVIANSDSAEDQTLKLEVRDALIAYMAEYSDSFDTAKEAAAFAASHCEELTAIASAVIADAGYSYNVTATVTCCDFPDKTYGDLTFPAGEYQALRVQIGEAKGQNWWCVLYPPLCFTEEGTASLPEESQTKLKESLSPEDYSWLENNTKPIIRFRLLDWLLGL